MNFKNYLLLFLSFYLICCKKNSQKKNLESTSIEITAEDNLRVVLPQLIEHFNYKYPKIFIHINYKPEIECKQAIFNSKADIVLNYTLLNQIEKSNLKKQFGYNFQNNILAFDGLVLVTIKQNKIDSLSKEELKKIINHNNVSQSFAIDNLFPNASYFYLKNELKIEDNALNEIYGIENFTKMIENISDNNNLIGFTSSFSLDLIKENSKIKLIKIKNEKLNEYFEPNKENLLNQKYNLTSPIYFTLRHNYETPATWFVNFMKQEKGQLIFKRNYALPIEKEINIRKIKINL